MLTALTRQKKTSIHPWTLSSHISPCKKFIGFFSNFKREINANIHSTSTLPEEKSLDICKFKIYCRSLGFNLIELLTTMVLIGILAAIAYPNYRQYVIQSRRSDGITMLMQIMQQQERFFTEQLQYNIDLKALGYKMAEVTTPVLEEAGIEAVSSSEGYYIITASLCPGMQINRCILLTATPIGTQEQDGPLSLNSLGEKTPKGVW